MSLCELHGHPERARLVTPVHLTRFVDVSDDEWMVAACACAAKIGLDGKQDSGGSRPNQVKDGRRRKRCLIGEACAALMSVGLRRIRWV